MPGFTLGETETPSYFIELKNYGGLGNLTLFQVNTYLLGTSLFSLTVYPDDRWKLLIGVFSFRHFLINDIIAASHFYSSSA